MKSKNRPKKHTHNARERTTALISAALRHVRDAEHLDGDHAHASPDQVEHLAGFGPECARKALLDLHHFDKFLADALDRVLGHDLGSHGDLVVALAVAFNPALRRYSVTGWADEYPELKEWKPECRYHQSGDGKPADKRQALLATARTITDDATVVLWLDGRLEGGRL